MIYYLKKNRSVQRHVSHILPPEERFISSDSQIQERQTFAFYLNIHFQKNIPCNFIKLAVGGDQDIYSSYCAKHYNLNLKVN